VVMIESPTSETRFALEYERNENVRLGARGKRGFVRHRGVPRRYRSSFARQAVAAIRRPVPAASATRRSAARGRPPTRSDGSRGSQQQLVYPPASSAGPPLLQRPQRRRSKQADLQYSSYGEALNKPNVTTFEPAAIVTYCWPLKL
jgi:hypothetical protein